MAEKIKTVDTQRLKKKINEPKSWFFQKINKTDRYLMKLIKKKRGAK